jgi:hypothetical protein
MIRPMNWTSLIRALRWLAIPPAMIGCWYLALIAGMLAYGFAEWFCPREEMISGFCMADWFAAADQAARCFGAAVAAAMMVAVATLLAPSQKRRVAIGVFALGCVAALTMGVGLRAYAELLAAVVGGAIALAASVRALR